MFDFLFFFNNILIGIGLAMDAFSVSLANGLAEPDMKRRKLISVALTFALFQAAMPLIGWVCVHTIVEKFGIIEAFIPWIALALLGFIGGKMLFEGIADMKDDKCGPDSPACELCYKRLTVASLIVQGIATSIDALSVGFTIAEYDIVEALVAVLLIAVVTFLICAAGIFLGKRFGTIFAGKSAIFGGAILIFIGLEIFITSFF